jgi:hypothetical protein
MYRQGFLIGAIRAGASIKSSLSKEIHLTEQMLFEARNRVVFILSAEPKLVEGATKSNGKETSRLTPPSVVYWSRIGFAVVGGVIFNLSGISGFGLALGTLGAIGIGVLVYAASVMTVKYIFGYDESVLAGPRKHVSIGMGSYIAWLIFTMILLNTILHPAVA